MLIRTETAQDIEAIEQLILAAFDNHPHHAPGQGTTEHHIVNRLRSEQALALSLVAEEDGQIIGHVAFSPVQINGQDSSWLCMAPVSVAPERQSQGIGSQLIRQALQTLQQRDSNHPNRVSGVVVLGEPAYYTRFGFHVKHGFTVPGVPPAYFQALAFVADAPMQGEVGFHPAFE
ncbi:MAG: N-acetyltransferase [Comamonas sp.]